MGEPCAPEWFLIRLERALTGPHADGTFALATGNAALDAAIFAEGIHRIEHALPASNRNPVNPERLRRLDRVYKFFVPVGADAVALAKRFAELPGVEYAEPDGVNYAYDAGVVYVSTTHNQNFPLVSWSAYYANTIMVPEAGLEPARPCGQGILRQNRKGGGSTLC